MNNIYTLIFTLATLFVVGFIIGYVIPQLKKRGIDVQAALDKTNAALAAVSKVADTVKPFIADKPIIDVFDRISEAAYTAVGNAEQLYKIGQLPAEQRKESAAQYVRDTLSLAGIKTTPEIQRVIDGAIESNVFSKKNE